MRVNRLSGRILTGLPVWLVMTACAGPAITVPPLTPTPSGTHRVGKFVWRDLLTDDVAAAKNFYAELFGWEFAVVDDDSTYTVILHRGRAIGGLVATADLEAQVNSSQWLGSLSVADVDRAVDEVKNSGGVVHASPRDVPERGRMALVTDPQGALVAFVRSGGGDPDDREATPGGWLWSELWTSDTGAAMSFYETLVGYTRERIDDDEDPYHILSAGDAPRAGVMEIPFDGVNTNWLQYVRVDDPAALAARVESLGGRVLIPVAEETRGGTVALIEDTTGGVLAIQKWPLEADERNGGR